jgi:hypothetical protein
MTYGFPPSHWDAAKYEAKEQLIVTAKRSQTISYSDLAARIKGISLAASGRKER